jgi:MFS family permease
MKIFSFSERKKQFLFFVLILTLSSIVSDLYVSSFLEMSLKLETTMNGVQWSLSLFVIMLALSHLVYGALAERFGRKKMLLLGLAISFLGSLLCAASINIFDLLFGRVLQGFGVGACVVLWREMAHERYGESSLLKESFYLMPVSVAIMILVPLLGGLIQTYLGWKANFVYILFHVFFVFLFVYFFYQENM